MGREAEDQGRDSQFGQLVLHVGHHAGGECVIHVIAISFIVCSQAVLASNEFMSEVQSPFWSRLPAFLKQQQGDSSSAVNTSTAPFSNEEQKGLASDYLAAIQCPDDENKENVNTVNLITVSSSGSSVSGGDLVRSQGDKDKEKDKGVKEGEEEASRYDKYSCLKEIIAIAR